MQKVIVIDTITFPIDNQSKFKVKEFTELNNLLENGYKIINHEVITTNNTTSNMYSIFFILEKN